MTVQISRPPGTDVAVNNPGTTLYIEGNEFTDGSKRYQVVSSNGTTITEIQQRVSGLWQPTSFKTGAASVRVGTLVRLSAAGSRLIATDDTEVIRFNATSDVEDGVSTSLATMLNAISFTERVIFRSDESSTFTGTIIENQTLANLIHLITGNFYFKTGATAASQAVRIEAWDGIGDTGLKLFDQTYPAASFPANTEIALTLEGFLEFFVGDDTFTRITSDADFSLKGAVTNDAWWLAVDISTIKDDDLLQTIEWVSGDNFEKGDWSTQDRRVYEANVTGVQEASFDDNVDKWDQLISIQGFDRILNSVDGNSIADNNGNLVIGVI